ncbi:hypothetical protein [Bacillus ndiopicus]|uniref:hypothetical protein n=1 Tax=Bacillus ndiopicus TaxID=1347368 RepID=UPI0005AB4F1B|nr:hypothetical protein [Bacillus ndiopicus]
MSKKKLILLLGIIGIFFVLLANPFLNFAKEPETTPYTYNELLPYIEKYKSLIFYINKDLRDQGYPSIVDYALLSDEKIEILIKLKENNERVASKNIQQIVKSVIEKQNFNPAIFQINISNMNKPTVKNENRLSYYDLMGYILLDMMEKNFEAFSLDYAILPENTEIIVKLADTIDENSRKEIQQIVSNILKQNNFDSNMFQINITNYKAQ